MVNVGVSPLLWYLFVVVGRKSVIVGCVFSLIECEFRLWLTERVRRGFDVVAFGDLASVRPVWLSWRDATYGGATWPFGRFGNYLGYTADYWGVIGGGGPLAKLGNVYVRNWNVGAVFFFVVDFGGFAQRFPQFTSEDGTGARFVNSQATGGGAAHFESGGRIGFFVYHVLSGLAGDVTVDVTIDRREASVAGDSTFL